MNYLLYFASYASVLCGFLILFHAKSAIHEIEGFVLFLIASVLFVGGVLSSQLKASATSKTQQQDEQITTATGGGFLNQ